MMKQKKWLVLLLMGMLLVTTGCTNKKGYDQAMEKAKEAMVDKKFEEAMSFLELALENKKEDKEARIYHNQLTLYVDALNDKEKEQYDQAISKLDKVIGMGEGFQQIKESGKDEKQLVLNMKNDSATIKSQIKEAKELTKQEKYEESMALIDEMEDDFYDMLTKEQLQTIKTIKQKNEAFVSRSESKDTTKERSDKKSSRHYSFNEERAITSEFLNWADSRADIGGMAVNDYYFTHGASGAGDWYARTPDGLVMVQQQHPDGRPGYDAYNIHGVGGIVFYHSIYGTTGITYEINDEKNTPSTATGFSTVADLNKPIVKYLLADNGIVYEYKSNGSFSDGFYLAGDDGEFDYWPGEQKGFIVSEDQDAQRELKRILANY